MESRPESVHELSNDKVGGAVLESNKACEKFNALEFFAGSGLVSHAIKRYFKVQWANDICEKKAAIYRANHGKRALTVKSIEDVDGTALPEAMLSWASFPCQDLSLAGLMEGITAKRSGLVWDWLRVLDEMKSRPPILVAENVVGLVSTEEGKHYKILHQALANRGYKVGAMLLDAANWIPQSRPRIFVIAVADHVEIPEHLMDSQPNWLHSAAVIHAANGLENWVWWRSPKPAARKLTLSDLVEHDAECDASAIGRRNVSMISDRHRELMTASKLKVFPAYRRTRPTGQMLELRFDGTAGCLRTPSGGSSRQMLIFRHRNEISTRLLTVRETARLMGAPNSYKLVGSYNDAYRAMGDAVAVPVARYLGKHILYPLACVAIKSRLSP